MDFKEYPQYLRRNALASEYTKELHLGAVRATQGAYGSVYRCRSIPLGTLFAVKSVRVANQSLLGIAIREYETLLKLHHPHIVSVYALFLEPESQEASLLMDFLPGQSLSQLLREGHRFTGRAHIEAEVKCVARQLLSALLYLDSQGVAHRDINPANIILAGAQATLIDFQTACSLTPSGLCGVFGTAHFQAPEMWSPSGYGTKVDVWSLGLVLKRLLHSSETPPSAAGLEVVAWCSPSNPAERCSAEQALQMAWLL